MMDECDAGVGVPKLALQDPFELMLFSLNFLGGSVCKLQNESIQEGAMVPRAVCYGPDLLPREWIQRGALQFTKGLS